MPQPPLTGQSVGPDPGSCSEGEARRMLLVISSVGQLPPTDDQPGLAMSVSSFG